MPFNSKQCPNESICFITFMFILETFIFSYVSKPSLLTVCIEGGGGYCVPMYSNKYSINLKR
jgi:hypothetical protein